MSTNDPSLARVFHPQQKAGVLAYVRSDTSTCSAEETAAEALRMWKIDDSSNGRTWVIAKDEANALLEFSRSDDESFSEYSWRDLEIEEVDPVQSITMECDEGLVTKSASEWSRDHGVGVLCSSWWL